MCGVTSSVYKWGTITYKNVYSLRFCVISGFWREVDEIWCSGYYDTYSGNFLPIYRANLSVPPSRWEQWVGPKNLYEIATMRCVIIQKGAPPHYLYNQFVKYPLLLEINEGKYLVRNTKGKALRFLYLCSQSVCPTPYMLSVIVYLNLYYLNCAWQLSNKAIYCSQFW